MRPTRSIERTFRAAVRLLIVGAFVGACGGGGGDGGTAPSVVTSVSIVLPTVAPSFKSLARSVEFAAVARDAAGVVMPGIPITWNTSNSSVATVSASGVVAAAGNGSATITARASGIDSPGMTVDVSQVLAGINVSAGAVAFGAIGATRQLVGTLVDSSGATITAGGTTTWWRAGSGATAIVEPSGRVTALAVGASDTAVTGFAQVIVRVPISVTQVVASILVSSTGSDTLRTTGRTKQYTADVRDSLTNAIGGAVVTWSSSAPNTMSVGAGTGLATALTDGSANIIATANAVSGQRAATVRRFASTFTLSPASATIVTPLGTQIFLGTAQDSVLTALPISWTSRSLAALALNASSGTQVTATAAGNGTSYVVMQAGTRADSALVTVSGQTIAPLTATVLVGAGTIFRSQVNLTSNPAVDTIAVGGTITWQGQGGSHTVQSQGAPSFTSSGTLGSGTFLFTFNVAGTYQYDCAIHGSAMSGRIVVR